MSEITVVTKADIVMPCPPAFFYMSMGILPISAVGEDDLREIGAAWTEELIKRAEEQRQEYQAEQEAQQRATEGEQVNARSHQPENEREITMRRMANGDD